MTATLRAEATGLLIVLLSCAYAALRGYGSRS
jgi:hypothetical protein